MAAPTGRSAQLLNTIAVSLNAQLANLALHYSFKGIKQIQQGLLLPKQTLEWIDAMYSTSPSSWLHHSRGTGSRKPLAPVLRLTML